MAIKEYSNEDITVVWNPEICIHSGNCVRGLQKVFDPKKRPWVNINAATTKELITTINNCPSGAIKYRRNIMEENNSQKSETTKIKVVAGGPLLVNGPLIVVDKDGTETQKEGNVALCRCGASKNKPYCDGSHKQVEFDK